MLLFCYLILQLSTYITDNRIYSYNIYLKGNKVYIIVRHVQDKVFKLRAFTKLDKINTVKSLSGIQNVNWELVKDGLIIHTDNSADSYPIYVLEVS